MKGPSSARLLQKVIEFVDTPAGSVLVILLVTALAVIATLLVLS